MASHKTDHPILALGDFNFPENDPEYAIFTGLTGMRDVAADLDRRQPTVWGENVYRRKSALKREDYVFARDGGSQGVVPVQIDRAFDETLELAGKRASYSNHGGLVAEFEVSPRGRPLARPDRGVIQRARELLSEGRADAERRQRGGRTWAGVGLGCATVASVGLRSRDLTRRRMLRGSLQCAALAALAPGVGLSVLSEVFVPDEIRAFDALVARLQRAWPETLSELIA